MCRIESGPFQEREGGVIQNNEPREWAITIASEANLSDGVELGPYVLCAISLPAAFTNTTITFQARTHSTVWKDVHNADGELSFDVTVSTFLIVDPADFAGCRYLRVRAGASAGQTPEEAERELVLVVRAV